VVHTRMVYDDYTFEDTRHRIVPKMIVGRRTCVRGTWGAEFVEELKPLPGERVVDKCRYSAFFNTDLEVGLRSRGIQTLIVTGVVAQVCVESTIRDAFFRDFDVILLRDCTASYDDQLYGATLKNVEISYGAVMTSTEIVDWLRAGATTP